MATEADKVNNGAMATLIAVVALGVVGVALAVTALTRMQQSAEYGGKEASAQAEYQALLKEQHEKLASGMPIEAAMQAVARELTKDPQSASPPLSPSEVAATAGAGGAEATAGGAGGAGGAAGGAPAGGKAAGGAPAGGKASGGAPAGGKAGVAPAAVGGAAAAGASGATPAKAPEEHKHEH
jgi:hypothetical protein